MTEPAEMRTATVRLSGDDWEMSFQITVPADRANRRMMLPVLQELTDAVVGAAVQTAESEGQRISCRAGCGACCRQIVPVSHTEARRLKEVLDAMPEPRRSIVVGRFAAAEQQLAAAGMLSKLQDTSHWAEGESRDIGLAYFHLGIPCPFLEAESCSIYEDRPLPCREYLVTSPAANCARPSRDTVHCVLMPMKVSSAALRLDEPAPGASNVPWVPLTLATAWAAEHPQDPADHTGPEWLQQILATLTRQPSSLAPRPSPLGSVT